jgi:hypothetical protein
MIDTSEESPAWRRDWIRGMVGRGKGTTRRGYVRGPRVAIAKKDEKKKAPAAEAPGA